MTKLRKLNLSGFIANEVQVKKFEWKVYYQPVFFSTAMSSPVKKSNIFSSDNTKKYDRQIGFLATVKKFHFYLIANRFPVKLTRNLVLYRQSLLSSFIKGNESVELTSEESLLNQFGQ